jgi:hypothetical protein
MARAYEALLGGLAGLIAVAGFPCPAHAQMVNVTVRVENKANLPTDLLAAAESRVAAMYASAGIDMTFVNRDDADLMIRLLSREGEERMQRDADTMGFAPYAASDRGRIAYVFQTRVDNITNGYSAARYIVLAVAIAHEVGHLLLPLNAHSTTGIMKATPGQKEFQLAVGGQLLFTPEQIAQIHRRLVDDTPRVGAR